MRNINTYTKKYIEEPFEKYQVIFRKKKVIQILNQYRHNSILEIGCAMNPLFLDFTDFDNLVIIEPSKIFYKNLQKQIKFSDLRMKIYSINDFFENARHSLKKYSFDYIIVSGLLHELENVPFFLRKLHSICKKDTIIHINVPNARSFHRLLAYEIGLIDSIFDMSLNNKKFQHHKVFDLNSLTQILRLYKFNIIKSGSYFIKPFTHKQMSLLLEHKIIDENILEGFDRMVKYLPKYGSEIYVNCNAVFD